MRKTMTVYLTGEELKQAIHHWIEDKSDVWPDGIELEGDFQILGSDLRVDLYKREG